MTKRTDQILNVRHFSSTINLDERKEMRGRRMKTLRYGSCKSALRIRFPCPLMYVPASFVPCACQPIIFSPAAIPGLSCSHMKVGWTRDCPAEDCRSDHCGNRLSITPRIGIFSSAQSQFEFHSGDFVENGKEGGGYPYSCLSSTISRYPSFSNLTTPDKTWADVNRSRTTDNITRRR